LYNLRADTILEFSMKLHVCANPVAKTKQIIEKNSHSRTI